MLRSSTYTNPNESKLPPTIKSGSQVPSILRYGLLRIRQNLIRLVDDEALMLSFDMYYGTGTSQCRPMSSRLFHHNLSLASLASFASGYPPHFKQSCRLLLLTIIFHCSVTISHCNKFTALVLQNLKSGLTAPFRLG
jgi:hypothetical protein